MRWFIVALLAAGPAAAAEPERGKAVYDEACSSCHMPAGTGVAGQQPALQANRFATGDPVALIRLVLEGSSWRKDKRQSWPNEMPTFEDLTDADIADVLTFVRGSFGNKASPVTAAQVAAVRARK